MTRSTEVRVTPIQVADLAVEGDRMPVYVHLIHHADGCVLVDTGLTRTHPAAADLDPRPYPLDGEHDGLPGIGPTAVDLVVNTHLHFDHCGGNHLFSDRPIYVQARELQDARSSEDYTIREWVDAPGVRYVPLDGEHEILRGIRLLPAPGHTPGSQIVVIDTEDGTIVIAGDTAVWDAELDSPATEGQHLILSLDPREVWLSHQHHPWQPPGSAPASAIAPSPQRQP